MESNKQNSTKTEEIKEEIKTVQNQTPEGVPPEEFDDLQRKVHSYSDQQWILFQRIGGGVLGLLCGYLLTYFGNFESIGMYGTIAAVLIALFVPGMVEKRVKRSVQKGRFALMIGLGIWLLAYLGIMLIQGVPLTVTGA